MKPAKPLTKEEEAGLRRHECPAEGTCPTCRLLATVDAERRGRVAAEKEATALAGTLESVVAILRKSWTARGIHTPVGFMQKGMQEAVSKADAALAGRRRQDTLKRGSTG